MAAFLAIATFLSNEAVKEVITGETHRAETSSRLEGNRVKIDIANGNSEMLEGAGRGNRCRAAARGRCRGGPRGPDREGAEAGRRPPRRPRSPTTKPRSSTPTPSTSSTSSPRSACRSGSSSPRSRSSPGRRWLLGSRRRGRHRGRFASGRRIARLGCAPEDVGRDQRRRRARRPALRSPGRPGCPFSRWRSR